MDDKGVDQLQINKINQKGFLTALRPALHLSSFNMH